MGKKQRTTAMARPKKPRYVDGIALPDNLYPDPKRRPNKWRYVLKDGKHRIFNASLADAIKAAEEANQLRDAPITINPKVPARDAILTHVERYIAWREGYDPELTEKQSWKDRQAYLRSFAKHFTGTKINHLTLDPLRTWWEDMTYHAQHARRAEFNKMVNYFAGQGLVPRLDSNPFTTADDKPRLVEKGKPRVKRSRMTMDDFWAIYNKAGEMGYFGIQVAMAISMTTTMRRGDICALRWDQHITETSLRKTINKSEAKLGKRSISVAHLEFEFDHHILLHRVIKRARELSLQHLRCPYVVSHMPQKRQKLKNKTHLCQVMPGRLSHLFEEVRDATRRFPEATDTYSPPSFHEVRALASKRLKDQGVDVKEVQQLMAHTDERTTMGYQVGFPIEYSKMHVVMETTSLGREF